MSDLKKYQQEQVVLTRKILFEQDKEVLRATAHTLAKNNNDLVTQSITISMEYEKLLHLVKSQAALIKKLKEEVKT